MYELYNDAWLKQSPELTVYNRSVPPEVKILLDDFGFALYDKYDHPCANAIARCQSSKKLSKWAFGNGAHDVQHDYNLIYEK